MRHVVLEDRTYIAPDGSLQRLEAGTVLDDAAHDVDRIRNAGVPLLEWRAELDPLLALYRSARDFSPEAGLVAQILAPQAFAPSLVRTLVGPWSDAIAASTTAPLEREGVAGAGLVAMRPGRVTGLSASLDAALAGAGSVAVEVTINGTPAGPVVAFTEAGGETEAVDVVSEAAVVAGDVVGVRYVSTAGITNTPALVADVELTLDA